MGRPGAALIPRHAIFRAAWLAAVLALASAACRGDADERGGPRRWALKSFTARDVAVEVSVERDGAGKTWLAGRFTPTRAGYHLYGKDLPREGLRGIGRPTLLEIVGAPGVRPAGALQADRAPGDLREELLGLTFPVYPAGPVTLRRPVTFARAGAITAELSVTYMACTEGTCLAPAIDKRFTVTIPEAATR
jgi:Disulphide bond corrector protein DsbC